MLEDDTLELVVQVGGKLRGRIRAPKDASQTVLLELARAEVGEWLAGKELVKSVVVPGRLVSFVVKG